MIVKDAQVLTLAVESEVGPIMGCGLIFKRDEEALAFAHAAQAYFEMPASAEKAFHFEIVDQGNLCTLRIAIVVGDQFTAIAFEEADRKILTDLTEALEQQPYFFIILCKHDESEILPYLTEEIEIYRAQLQVDGQTILGNRKGRWPAKGTLQFT